MSNRTTDIYEVMQTQRAIRRWTDEPVDRETIERIIQAGCWAPSGSNSQPWGFLVVTDDGIRERLAAAISDMFSSRFSGDMPNPDDIDDPTTRRMMRGAFNLFDNFAAAPVWIMVTGAPVAVWAAAGWPFGEVLAWAAWVPLEYLIQAARLAAALPGASVPIPGFSLGHAAAVYAAIALLVALGGRRPWRIPQGGPRLIRFMVIGLGVVAFALPPVLAVVAAPRLFNDSATRITVDGAGAAPTVYARQTDASLVVAGDRLRPYVLDSALPAWDPTVDLLAMPRGDGRATAVALGLLLERPVTLVAAPPLHGLGPALVTHDRARRAPVDAAPSASAGGLTVRMLNHASGLWTELSSADVTVLVAPPGAARPPPGTSADVLVLGRRSTLGPSAFHALGSSGIRLLLAPHPTRAQIAVVAIDPDGQPGIREVVTGTVVSIRSQSGDLEVRQPG